MFVSFAHVPYEDNDTLHIHIHIDIYIYIHIDIYIYMYRAYTNAFLSNNYLVRMLCCRSIGNPGDQNRFVRKSHETNTNPHLKTPAAGT